jgi:hypothetical protein
MHSWDVMFVEVLQWLLWFNPLIYLYKIQLRQIHEFEADQSVTISHSKTTYINILLNQSFGSQNVSFINPFFHSSHLKKRISMLQQTHSSNLRKLKYLLILPAMALAILLSCSQDEILEPKLSDEEMKQEVLDFMKTFVGQEPSIFQMIKEKPSLKKIFDAYDLEIKDNYSEIEERKIGFVLNMVTIITQNDESYHKQILKEINNSEGLELAYEKIQKTIEDAKNYKVGSSFEGPVTDDTQVPFALLDNVPHPAECSELTGDELKKCVSQHISKHVNQNFDVSKFSHLGPGKYRVSVQFKIDTNGQTTNARARGANRELEEEAMKAILSLPQLIPGEVNGEKVGVLYGLPINFVIN